MTKPVQIINDYWLKEIILNGNPDLNKFYKDDLIKMINILKYENQKYKEVINKAIKYIETHKRKDEFLELNEWGARDLLDILKEVD